MIRFLLLSSVDVTFFKQPITLSSLDNFFYSLPTHFPAAWEYPESQRQEKEPFVFWHTECSGQIDVFLHSSISSVQYIPSQPCLQVQFPDTLSHAIVFSTLHAQLKLHLSPKYPFSQSKNVTNFYVTFNYSSYKSIYLSITKQRITTIKTLYSLYVNWYWEIYAIVLYHHIK